jgi:hypothetical protein
MQLMTKLTTILLTLSLVVGFSLLTAEVSLAQSGEIVDAGTIHTNALGEGVNNPSGFNPYTQRSDMHACPPNWYMSGVHINNNWFLCVSFIEDTTSQRITYTPSYEANSDEQEDAHTQDMGMHACPPGSVMSGYRDERDRLLCVPSPFGGSGVRTQDRNPGTQRARMHACPFASVMAGIHANLNDLLCEAGPSARLRPGGPGVRRER